MNWGKFTLWFNSKNNTLTSISAISLRDVNSLIVSSSCFLTNSTKASTDLCPLYSRFAGCPFRITFKVGYLVIWNLVAKPPKKFGSTFLRNYLYDLWNSMKELTFLITVNFAEDDAAWFCESFFHFICRFIEYWL